MPLMLIARGENNFLGTLKIQDEMLMGSSSDFSKASEGLRDVDVNHSKLELRLWLLQLLSFL